MTRGPGEATLLLVPCTRPDPVAAAAALGSGGAARRTRNGALAGLLLHPEPAP